MTEAEQPTPTPEETLKRIQALLEDGQASTRLAAIQELASQNYSSPALLRRLETLALRDPSKPVRAAARQALASPTHRYIQGRTTKLDRRERQAILREIAAWNEQGLLKGEQADVLRARYDFDLQPSAPHPQPEAAPVSPAPGSAQASPVPPSEERPSLSQTLLSETSIKIALYLGAFFVIAAAAILAAVVESARLPILLAATALFGGAALAIRKRLPQPGFALFVVFSFLLPTDANVLADMLNLGGKANALYWFATMGGMALTWGFGTWFYRSRLFSLAAFVALAISFGRLADALGSEIEVAVLLLNLVTLAGLGGAYLLKRWQSQRFSLPLFLLAQVGQFLLSLLALVAIFDRTGNPPAAWNLLTAFYWLAAAGFYLASDLVIPYFLFPWLAAAVLFPFPLTLAQGLSLEGLPRVVLAWGWGLALALLGDGLRMIGAQPSSGGEKARRFALPLLLVSLPVILTSAGFGFAEEVAYGFACLLAGALLYALLQVLQPRAYVWSISLLLGSGAYFSFYALPFMAGTDVFAGYRLLIPSLLYLLPDLALGRNFPSADAWRWPLRAFGGFLAFCNLAVVLPVAFDQPGAAAIAYGVYAVFFIAYALRLGKAWLAYFATASAALGVTFALQHFDVDSWLPALTGLAALYCLGGWMLLKRRPPFTLRVLRGDDTSPWSGMMRVSGLSLGGLVSLAALVNLKDAGGWYVLLVGALFTVEMFQHQKGWLEAGPQSLFPAGLALLLYNFEVDEPAWHLLGIGLAWLALDWFLGRAFLGKRPLRWAARGLAALAILANTLYLLTLGTDEPRTALLCFAAYALAFLGLAVLHREARLGYGATTFLMLTMVFAFRTLGSERWLLPVAALGVLYYGAGFFLRKRGGGQGWPFVLWTSGIGIGLAASCFAPFHADLYQNGLVVAIPPALTATLVAAEAFARRNVWLGFPANALYLLAYFLILVELQVDEPQFYSIGAAGLGLLMHYLLTRAGSKTGAFVTGMVSQLVLLGVTYIQFLSNEKLVFFAILFFQALAVLAYGIVIRSRSLVTTPIIFAVLAVISVMYGLMQGIWAVVLIGCTGLLLLMLGILAVVLREHIKQVAERFSDWGA
ncbi:MAG: HEAT repeat domain-containing protein [Chloroflexota bacterium]